MRRAEERTPHRRGHTRWLMIIPLSVLALVILGIIVLEALAPQPGPQPAPVDGVPRLTVSEVRACTRADETLVQEIRDEHRTREGRVSSAQVQACPSAFDRLPIRYAGEVVGELLPRRGGAWAQVNDDLYALEVGPLVGHRELDGFNNGLTVWFPDGLHEQIDEVGRAGRRGDVLLIDGTLLQADPMDGGGITVRAERVEVLARSFEIEAPLHTIQAIVALVLAIAAAGVLVWSRRPR